MVSHVHGLKDNIKMAIYPDQCTFSTKFLAKSQLDFAETSKIHVEMQETRNSPNNPGKEQSWRTHNPQFQVLLKATISNTMWY